MTYTPATSLPSLYFFQWGTPSAPNPTLSAPLSPTNTTIYFSNPPLDHNGVIITGGFLMGVKNSSSYVMTCWIAPGAVAVDGLSATVVQGIRLEGLDYTTSDPTLIPSEGFSAGDAISCNISGVIGALLSGALKGQVSTNGLSFIMGDGTNTVVTISQKDAASTKGFIRKDPTAAKAQFSDDGITWVNFTDVSASVLVKNTAADTTPSYLASKLSAGANVTLTTLNPGGNETTEIAVSTGIVSDFAATAKEAILIGAPVAMSSTASNVENLINSQFITGDAGTASAFDTATVSLVKGCQAAANKVAIIYRESSNWYVIAGTVPTNSKVITWGARQSISANSAAILPGATYLAENAVVFTYVTSANTLKARAATLSGTVFTFDTEQAVHAATVDSCDVAMVDTNKVLFAFNDSATFGRTSIGTLAAGVLTVDTVNEQALFATNAISQISVCKAASAKGFVAFRDNTSQDCTQIAISCGSTTPSAGAVLVADANNCTSMQASQITTDSVLVAWRDATSNVTNAIVASLAGTVITNPTSELLVSSVASATTVRCFAYSATQALIAWKDTTNSKESYQSLYIASTTLRLSGAVVDYQAAATTADATNIIKVNDNNKVLFTYLVTTGTEGWGRVYQGYNNTDKYAGTARTGVATGAAVNVRQIGIDTNQTGLTAGNSVVVNGISIGKALTTTSMEVIVPKANSFGSDLYVVDVSTTDDYVINPNPAPASLMTGMEFKIKFTTANTGASTVNVSGLGALAIKKVDGNDTTTGDITAAMQGTIRYNGTNFTLISPSNVGFTSRFRARQTATNMQSWLTGAAEMPVVFDVEVFDSLSEYDNTGVVNTATLDVGTSTTNVVDAAATFVAGDVGAAFVNITRAISSRISAYISATNVTISPAIAGQVSTDTYGYNRSWFIPTATGYYQCEASVVFITSAGATGTASLFFYVNGAAVVTNRVGVWGAGASVNEGGINISAVLLLTAGQKLQVYLANNSGELLYAEDAGVGSVSFSAHRLS